MFEYETGLLLAFVLWLANAIVIVTSVNSTLEQNLNRIGQRLSWVTLTPKTMDQDDVARSTLAKVFRYLIIVRAGLPFMFLSWLYVADVGLALYRRARDSGAPQVVRDFRWKMKKTNLSVDQIVRELMKVSEEDAANFEQFRTKLVAEMRDRGLSVGN